MRLPVVTLVALALATPAAAQMAYRNTFPDGRVVYSDRPLDGAAVERPLAPPPPTTDPTLAAPAAAPAPVAEPAPAAAAAPVAEPAPAAAAPAPEPAPSAAAAPVEAVPGARWPPPPDAQPMTVAAPASVPVAAPAPVPEPQPSADRAGLLTAADQAVRAAQHNFAAVQATVEAGREPLPGERTGLARGGSRLNESYWDRQRQLETALADAQTRLDQAVAERNSKRF